MIHRLSFVPTLSLLLASLSSFACKDEDPCDPDQVERDALCYPAGSSGGSAGSSSASAGAAGRPPPAVLPAPSTRSSARRARTPPHTATAAAGADLRAVAGRLGVHADRVSGGRGQRRSVPRRVELSEGRRQSVGLRELLKLPVSAGATRRSPAPRSRHSRRSTSHRSWETSLRTAGSPRSVEPAFRPEGACACRPALPRGSGR